MQAKKHLPQRGCGSLVATQLTLTACAILVAIKSFLLATRIASEPKAHAAWFTPNVGVSQDHTSRVDHTSPQGQVKLHQ